MAKKFKWTLTKIIVTILLIIGLAILIYYGMGGKFLSTSIDKVSPSSFSGFGGGS